MNYLHHRPLAVAVALCVTALAPLGAAAQSATTDLDRVEVTGTRIKRAEVEGQVPVQTLNRADIERTGLTCHPETGVACRRISSLPTEILRFASGSSG